MSRVMVLLFLLVLAPGESEAQRTRPDAPEGVRQDRRRLEERFRERFEKLLKERLALSDSQLARVVEVNARLDVRRRALFAEERTVRLEMREALSGSDDPAAQERLSKLLDRALSVQHSRLDLMETEQRELAEFLTPLQRARYLGLQEQLRQRVDEMRRRSAGDTSPDLFGPESTPRSGTKRRPGVQPGSSR
ncbi:MAG: hypothetical protein IPF98_18580 [Gemmatimonadetes bacterium]|nr:hypothetical protein [Gemmatimonadota bacterium]MCC6772940.1 hypothetical protein [Gemmatimonadaceae bacterium]